jgi:hypothetical protein
LKELIVIKSTDDSVFRHIDTASARAHIVAITEKLKVSKIAIVGVGGTGSYVLDHVARTPVREIDLFDRDHFLQHNAFRSPGAPSRMRRKIGALALVRCECRPPARLRVRTSVGDALRLQRHEQQIASIEKVAGRRTRRASPLSETSVRRARGYIADTALFVFGPRGIAKLGTVGSATVANSNRGSIVPRFAKQPSRSKTCEVPAKARWERG